MKRARKRKGAPKGDRARPPLDFSCRIAPGSPFLVAIEFDNDSELLDHIPQCDRPRSPHVRPEVPAMDRPDPLHTRRGCRGRGADMGRPSDGAALGSHEVRYKNTETYHAAALAPGGPSREPPRASQALGHITPRWLVSELACGVVGPVLREVDHRDRRSPLTEEPRKIDKQANRLPVVAEEPGSRLGESGPGRGKLVLELDAASRLGPVLVDLVDDGLELAVGEPRLHQRRRDRGGRGKTAGRSVMLGAWRGAHYGTFHGSSLVRWGLDLGGPVERQTPRAPAFFQRGLRAGGTSFSRAGTPSSSAIRAASPRERISPGFEKLMAMASKRRASATATRTLSTSVSPCTFLLAGMHRSSACMVCVSTVYTPLSVDI
jgi:hypothetical protein